MKYLKYLKYLLKHKYFVLIECFKEGLYWQGLIHDLSKFSLDEFLAYSWSFYATDKEKKGINFRIERYFKYSWLHHQHKNKHHWNYWVYDQKKQKALPMPKRYMLEMLCDWRAMGVVFGDTARMFWEKNKNKMIIHPETIAEIEKRL